MDVISTAGEVRRERRAHVVYSNYSIGASHRRRHLGYDESGDRRHRMFPLQSFDFPIFF